MGDNGDLKPEAQEPEVKNLFNIGLNKENIVMVSGDLNNKKLCYHLLAEAIKIVTDYQPKIINPTASLFEKTKHRMINFAKFLKH